jgi:hypothetical protein
MHITIDPVTGKIEMDTNGSTPAEVAGTLLSIQKEMRKQLAEEARGNRPAPVDLGNIGAELWDYLVDNDNPRGVHVGAIARHFGIDNGVAASRCQHLLDEKHAERVSKGRYRAVTG